MEILLPWAISVTYCCVNNISRHTRPISLKKINDSVVIITDLNLLESSYQLAQVYPLLLSVPISVPRAFLEGT